MKRIILFLGCVLCISIACIGAGCSKKQSATTNTAPAVNSTVNASSGSSGTGTNSVNAPKSNTNTATNSATGTTGSVDAKQMKNFKGEVDSSQKSVQESQSVEGSLNSSTSNL